MGRRPPKAAAAAARSRRPTSRASPHIIRDRSWLHAINAALDRRSALPRQSPSGCRCCAAPDRSSTEASSHCPIARIDHSLASASHHTHAAGPCIMEGSPRASSASRGASVEGRPPGELSSALTAAGSGVGAFSHRSRAGRPRAGSLLPRLPYLQLTNAMPAAKMRTVAPAATEMPTT